MATRSGFISTAVRAGAAAGLLGGALFVWSSHPAAQSPASSGITFDTYHGYEAGWVEVVASTPNAGVARTRLTVGGPAMGK